MLSESELNEVLSSIENPWVMFEAANPDSYEPFGTEELYSRFHYDVIRLLCAYAIDKYGDDVKQLNSMYEMINTSFDGGKEYVEWHFKDIKDDTHSSTDPISIEWATQKVMVGLSSKNKKVQIIIFHI
jgi:hypothetical protein